MRQHKIDKEADDNARRFLMLLESERQRADGVPYARVTQLLQLLKSLDNVQDQGRLELIFGELDTLCERYEWVVRFWRPVSAPRSSLALCYSSTHKALSVEEHWEHWAVGWLLKLVNEPRWNRLRQCHNPDCRRWFLARKVQRGVAFCKAACRQKVNASNPIRRAEKNKKACEAYHALTERNKKRDEAAGFTPAKKTVAKRTARPR